MRLGWNGHQHPRKCLSVRTTFFFLAAMLLAGAQVWAVARLLSGAGREGQGDVNLQADASASGGAASGEAETSSEEPMIRITRNGQTIFRSVEDYLPGMVAVQMPETGYEPAVWQCQAVIARTYLRWMMKGRQVVDEEDLSPDVSEESPGGTEAGKDADNSEVLAGIGREELAKRLLLAEQAVSATSGMVMKYEGGEILPLFHAISAGQTRSGEEAFPYLVSVACSADTRREDFTCRMAFPWETFSIRLRRAGEMKNADASALPGSIQIIERDSAGYVEKIQIGGHIYMGDQVRDCLGLPSAHFSVVEGKEEIMFTVQGSGHGYGLSQSGAQAMAETEASYEEILNYFYHDIVIEKE